MLLLRCYECNKILLKLHLHFSFSWHEQLIVRCNNQRNIAQETVTATIHELQNVLKVIDQRSKLQLAETYVILCAIWCHFCNLKNVKKNHGGVLLLVNCRPQLLLKVTLLHWCFSRFLNCTIGTKSRNASLKFKKYINHWYGPEC